MVAPTATLVDERPGRERQLIRFVVFGLVVILGISGLTARMIYLQFVRGQVYQAKAEDNRTVTQAIPSTRGLIYDRKGRLLVSNEPAYAIKIRPSDLPFSQRAQVVARLSSLLGIDQADINVTIYSNPGTRFDPVRIAQDVPMATANIIAEERLALPGVEVAVESKRHYVDGPLMSQIIGYTGAIDAATPKELKDSGYQSDDLIGRAGVEATYEETLRGTYGQETVERDATGRKLRVLTTDRAAQAGDSLNLTIDTREQKLAEKAVTWAMRRAGLKRGVMIVMNPQTGEILAMVSLPDYDPTNFSEYAARKNDPLKNRVVADPYEPGSIFKPIAASVALDAGAIDYNDVIFCENGYFSRYKISEYMNHVYGNLSVKMIIAKSSNIGMAKIGLKLGQKRLHDGLRLFGFGQSTGLDLPGEDAGIFRPTNKWDGWTVTRIPFGHAISVTAIQILRAYCIIANGGSAVAPHIVRAVVDDQGTIRKYVYPAPLTGYIIKPEVAKWIREEALVAVVNEGTGDQAKLKDIQTFGKTGTANIAIPGGRGYDTANYIASFVGGAPPEKPELMVLVSIGRPNRALGKGYSGGRVAAPVFKEIMEEILKYRHTQQPEQ